MGEATQIRFHPYVQHVESLKSAIAALRNYVQNEAATNHSIKDNLWYQTLKKADRTLVGMEILMDSINDYTFIPNDSSIPEYATNDAISSHSSNSGTIVEEVNVTPIPRCSSDLKACPEKSPPSPLPEDDEHDEWASTLKRAPSRSFQVKLKKNNLLRKVSNRCTAPSPPPPKPYVVTVESALSERDKCDLNRHTSSPVSEDESVAYLSGTAILPFITSMFSDGSAYPTKGRTLNLNMQYISFSSRVFWQ
jgi:hypothetical protein